MTQDQKIKMLHDAMQELESLSLERYRLAQELESTAADRDRLARELAELRAALAKVTTPATLAHVATQPR